MLNIRKSLKINKVFKNLAFLKQSIFSFTRGRDDRSESHTPGHPSGKIDSEGHPLKSDNKPDMRFKDNNPDAGNPKYDNDRRGESKDVNSQDHYVKSDGTPDLRYKENNPDAGIPGHKNDHRGEFSGEFDKQGHHLKSNRSHDMRFKENRESGIESPEQEANTHGRKK